MGKQQGKRQVVASGLGAGSRPASRSTTSQLRAGERAEAIVKVTAKEHALLAEQLDLNFEDASKYNLEHLFAC